MVLAFSTEAFLDGWERTGALIMGSGYNWDRPCTFIDNDTFVLAMDDQSVTGGVLDEDELAAYSYQQLAFFAIPDLQARDGNSLPWLEPTALVSCDLFPRNANGEVKGELHYDPETRCLVAMTESDGTYLVSLTGQIVEHLPEISLGTAPAHTDMGSRYGPGAGWAYSTRHRRFYRWHDGTGIAERALPAHAQVADA